MKPLFQQKIAGLRKACIVVLLLGCFSSQPVYANTPVTSSFNVTATVLTACLIVAAPLLFGNYDPTSTSPTTGSTTLIATCTLSAPYTISLNNGNGVSADYSAGASGRKMTIQTSGTATLGYNLYQDSGYATVWGNVSGAWLAGTGSGLPQTITVYGRIPALQVAGAGSYLDSVTATLAF